VKQGSKQWTIKSQVIDLVSDWYPEYIKNSYNSII
jgi:hypothetical protein